MEVNGKGRAMETAETKIHVRLTDLAGIWGVAVPTAHQFLAKRKALPDQDDRYDLKEMLELRGVRCDEETFDLIMARCVARIGDQTYNAQQVARDEAIFALYATDERPKSTGRPRKDAAPGLDPDREAQIQKAQDEYRQLKNRELAAKITAQELKLRQTSGELIPLKRVERDLATAAAIVKSTMEILPGDILPLVNPDLQEEARRRIDAAVERCLYAIVRALGADDDEE